MAKTPAWQRAEGKNPKGGLNAKAAGRPYPNLVDNMRAAKGAKGTKG